MVQYSLLAAAAFTGIAVARLPFQLPPLPVPLPFTLPNLPFLQQPPQYGMTTKKTSTSVHTTTTATAKPSSATSKSAIASSFGSSSTNRAVTPTISKQTQIGTTAPSRSGSSSGAVSVPRSASSVQVVYNSGCPPVTLTTVTVTYPTYLATSTSTASEITFTDYVSTVKTTETRLQSYEVTSTVQESPIISYYSTSTEYYFDIHPASTTVTIPTPSGFTPVRCQAEYYNPTKTFYRTHTTDTTITPSRTVTLSDPYTATYLSFVNTGPTVIVTQTSQSLQSRTTLSTTVTRTAATSTVYAACATNNVTPDYPPNKFPYIGVTMEGQNGTTAVIVGAADATDCCAVCQGNPQCAASLYGPSESQFFNATAYNQCLVFLKPQNDTVCSTQFVGARQDYSYTEPRWSMSNGDCGKISFYFDGRDYLYGPDSPFL